VSKRQAVISIGTNSTRLLLADLAPEIPHVEITRSIGTRIGEGLGQTGKLGDEPVRRTIDAIRQLHGQVRGHYLRLFVIATSALRRAENGDEFTRNVESITGAELRVLAGDEEAQAAYRGAITVFGPPDGKRSGVIDTGGGSTEYAVGTGNVAEQLHSCEIGAVRLTEAEPALAGRDGPVDEASVDRAREIARTALMPLRDFPRVDRLAFVGGSATTAAAILRARSGPIASQQVTRTQLQTVLARLCSMTLEERKLLPGMRAQRADILPGGIVVLDTALEIVEQDAATATTADLLLGFLLQQRDASAPARQDNAVP
jgi:exopolyphosphatase/guanosine-5'-triphosphate,3'-diphosphate pyrophosphatase